MRILLMMAAVATQGAEPVAALRLVPFPKEIRAQANPFPLAKALVFEVSGAEGELLAQQLNAELKRVGCSAPRLQIIKSANPAFRLAARSAPLTQISLPTNAAPEGYALEVRADEVVCAAREPAGLYYGLQTLRQLIRANLQGNALPGLTIRDWPSLRWRCFQDDMTRGPSSTLDTLKFEAELASQLKLNLMTYYMEYQFAFQKHPRIGPTNGSLLGEDLSALVAFARPLHLDLLGNQQSFGHFGGILKHPEFAQLRETGDVLTPVREETYQLLDDLYSEVCPRLPFPWFNVCCDETDGLGTGPAKELAGQIGVGGVYVKHIRRVHDLLRDKYQKRMMMWGDIILQHPDRLGEVPKDTIMLTWGYDARASFEDQIVPFAKSGYDFFVCPGVNNWSRILPDFGVAMTNIHNFVRDGVKHGALGMLNTDWEDDGEAINAVKWHADAWAAECAWNASATDPDIFNRRVSGVLFGDRGDFFGQAIMLLAQTHRMPAMKGMFNQRFWQNDFFPTGAPATTRTAASNLLAVVRPAILHLRGCRQEAKLNQQLLDAIEFGARRMELIGQRMLDGLKAAERYEKVFEAAANPTADGDATVRENLLQLSLLLIRNREAHEALGRDFAALWRAESKPYALDWTMQRYTNIVRQFADLERKLPQFQASVAQGRPLPSPEELGLAIPRPLSRQIVVREIQPAALAPQQRWLEPTATHRLGMTVSAGDVDRVDLPVELELTLPTDLGSAPVRAFRLNDKGLPSEVMVQLDATPKSVQKRLVFMLPGDLPKGTTATVRVYLGLRTAPAPLPGAVRTSPDNQGRYWLENDQVRLLLGAEGAHIYRWELKTATNRDLTMPGETGWAGFSDMATHRSTRYDLKCTARGPALVEYVATAPDGHTKTIRLFGGMSWIEVFLSEPTTVYWDFDNPKNFAADGPTPGDWLFSTGQSGRVGGEADGVPAQVKAAKAFWGIKYNAENLALGICTPETAARHLLAPGAGAGGAGIESSPPAMHFVTFAGKLKATPAATMNQLQTTLDLKRPIQVRIHSLQAR